MAAFIIEFAPEAEVHLMDFSKRDCVNILDSIDRQLSNEPKKETRNRKPLRPNPLAGWELRIGAFRVFYEPDESRRKVAVLAVGNTLFIAGKEFPL